MRPPIKVAFFLALRPAAGKWVIFLSFKTLDIASAFSLLSFFSPFLLSLSLSFSMDTTNQWPQGIGLVKPINEASKSTPVLERKPRPQKEQALNCPRCNSTNTKFCYYNNYSLSQPRYFCKTCRRYWTEGGTLRNVPVGGGSRKNKRSTSSNSSSSSPAISLKKLPDLTTPTFSQPSTSQNPKIHDGQDLNLAHPPCMSGLLHFPFINSKSQDLRPNTISSSNFPALELLKAGIPSGGSLSSLVSIPLSDSNSNIFYSSVVLPSHEQMKPKFSNFSLHELENGYGSVHEAPVQDTSARVFLPYEELRPVSTVADQYDEQQNKRQGESTGFWNGMLGGGSW